MNQYAYAKQAQPIHMSGSEYRNGHSEGKAGEETAAVAAAVGLTQEGQPCMPCHTPEERDRDSAMAALLTVGTLPRPLPCPLPVTKKKNSFKNVLSFLSMSN